MELIEKYKVSVEGVNVEVFIEGENKKALSYRLSPPTIAPATLALVTDIRKSLTAESLSTSEILDPRLIEKIKTRFRDRASALLDQKLKLAADVKKILIGYLINEMLGLGDIEYLIGDEHLEEIVILSSKEPIRIYHKKYGWLGTNVTPETEEDIINYSNIIARRVGRQITVLTPLLDAHMVTGDRANAVLYPISTKGNTIVIRKFARDPWTVVDFIANGTITVEVASLLWLAMQYEMNILVTGGTASGKTSILNALIPFIQSNHRVITVEQTRELQLPSFLYWTPMVTRLPNPEGKGEVSMLDLIVNSLRMRPDRIILGELRRKEEAEVLFEAMHTGHSVYATLHANNVAETITRLVNPPLAIPENLLGAVDLCLVMFRDRRKGIRRIYQLGEFISTEEDNKVKITPNILYRYKPSEDKVVEHAKSLVLFDNLTRITGMSNKEISEDLAEKSKILLWMAKKGLRNVEDVGRMMHDYYVDRDKVLRQIK